MMLPVSDVQPLAILAGFENGQLPSSILVQVSLPGGISGQLLAPVAEHLTLMGEVIRSDIGVVLTATSNGDLYRTLSAQESLFRQRYSPVWISGHPTKQWNGRTWYLKSDPGTGKFVAEAATPGTSNHGWGRAIDLDELVNGNRVGLSARALQWLIDNAHRFGFSFELQREPWHVRYFWGDQLPVNPRRRDMIAFVRVKDTDAVWLSSNTAIRTWMQTPQALKDHQDILRFYGYVDADFIVHVIDAGDLDKYGVQIGPNP